MPCKNNLRPSTPICWTYLAQAYHRSLKYPGVPATRSLRSKKRLQHQGEAGANQALKTKARHMQVHMLKQQSDTALAWRAHLIALDALTTAGAVQ